MKYAVVFLLGACAQPAVEMHLELPDSSAPFDMSCVGAIDLLPLAKGDTKTLDIGYRFDTTMDRTPCVPIDSPSSFDDIESQIRGKFDLPLPPGGLAAVELRGRPGGCDDPDNVAVFYGGAMYDAKATTLDIPVRHNISCDQADNITVKPIVLSNLLTAKACTAPTTNGNAFVGDVRPTLLGGNFEPLVFEEANTFIPLTSGAAMLGAYSASFAGSCVAAAYDDINTSGASTCINAGTTPACAEDAGAIEVPVIDYGLADNIGAALSGTQVQGFASLVTVWSASAKAPVQGATVTTGDPSASVLFGDPSNDAWTPAAAGTTATGPTGTFLVVSSSITSITVGATGKPSVTIYIGSASEEPGTALVVLQ